MKHVVRFLLIGLFLCLGSSVLGSDYDLQQIMSDVALSGNLHQWLHTNPVSFINLIGQEPAKYENLLDGSPSFSYVGDFAVFGEIAFIWEDNQITEVRGIIQQDWVWNIEALLNSIVYDHLYGDEYSVFEEGLTPGFIRVGNIPYLTREYSMTNIVTVVGGDPFNASFIFVMDHIADYHPIMLIIRAM